MQWTIPNILTVGRILAAPGVALCFVVFDRPVADWVAFFLFVGAALTDFFDGWLARKLNQMSEIGKMLDPIADKAMVIIGLMVLVARPLQEVQTENAVILVDDSFGLAILLAAVVIAVREILVSGLREYLGDVKLPVTNLAKWKTTAQMVAIGCLLALPTLPSILVEFGFAHPYAAPGTVRDGLSATQILLFTSTIASIALLYLAALLTLITGWDYFRKGLAYIGKREES